MSGSGQTTRIDGQTTLLSLLGDNAVRFGARKAAMRVKKYGIWQETSWETYLANVRLMALGLITAGLESKDVVAVIGHNRPTSLYAILAAQAAGGMPVALHQDATAAEVKSLIDRFSVSFVIAEDQEQVDKILESGAATGLKKLIYINPRGMRRYGEDCLLPIQQLNDDGAALLESRPDKFTEACTAINADDIALICTTSGSSSHPHGAMLSHRNLISMATTLADTAGFRQSDEFVSFLPLAWFGEAMISLAAALCAGFTVNFPESPDTAMADLREIGPHIIFAPPGVWEGIVSSIQVRMMDSTPFKRFMYNRFMPLGQSAADARLTGKPCSIGGRLAQSLAHLALMRALRDRIGLSRTRVALTGGSAMGEDTFRFFHAIGVNLKQVYGLTEISGVACMHRDGTIKGGTVGSPLPGTELAISAEGEILLKSAGICCGYLGEPDAYAELITDGWLHTGDAGHLDADGQLVVSDRIASIIRTVDGTKLAPAAIENKLKFSPYVKEALLIGDNRPFLCALICIDGMVVGKWSGDNKLSYNSYSDLAAKEEVYDLIAGELAKANAELPADSQVRRFTILYKELDADDHELTRNGKVRRRQVEERFLPLIDAIYSDQDELAIDVSIDLQEGRSARIQGRVLFRNL